MRVYTFGDGQSEGAPEQLDLLGRKAAGLARLCRFGAPVPPGFTIPTSVCARWLDEGPAALDAVWPEVLRGLEHIEALTGRRLGDPDHPLLLSVRSGAPESMPGVLDTVLNVGLNDACTQGLGRAHDDAVFALGCQLRFLQMYAAAALGVAGDELRHLQADLLEELQLEHMHAASPEILEGLRAVYRTVIAAHGTAPGAVPAEALDQLRGAIGGVLDSWSRPAAQACRAARGIANAPGTAVTVQAMVFGNHDTASGTGVAISRDPNTGEPALFGEFLARAQGEAVVGGRRTPQPLRRAEPQPGLPPSLQEAMPAVFRQLLKWVRGLEQASGDMQEVEFTIEQGTLWLLQVRSATRSARAEVRVAVDLANQGLVSPKDALLRQVPERLAQLLHVSADLESGQVVVAKGLPASPGAVSGTVAFTAAAVVKQAAAGASVIMVRPETSVDELPGIRAAAGLLTMRGGMTSHAALVARGLGICCVTGCTEIVVNAEAGTLYLRRTGQTLVEGDTLTLDGNTGEVMLGAVNTRAAQTPAAYRQLMRWADQFRHLSVRASANTAAEVRVALEHGADGIGLCRTEHMFLSEDRMPMVQAVLLAPDGAARRSALLRMLSIQRAEFQALFAVSGRSVVAIRLLDLPLHELLPEGPAAQAEAAHRLGVPVASLRHRVEALKARNPRMGLRGCRLGLVLPELYELQARALFEAMAGTETEVNVQIALPLVTASAEVRRVRRLIDAMAIAVATERTQRAFRYTVGCMIESPRACLIADELAEVADFFLFGANDLTCATYLMHRDDADQFLPFYLEAGVFAHDPFVRLDDRAVVRLIKLAIEAGRAVRPDLQCGLTGAQTSDPETVEVCEALGLNFVSVAPHRVSVARLAASQAAIKGDRIS
jgi:pyruvate,orthophosphate dikinase